mmetsp:Transcript_4458/g.11156  ORF Transcript_4458/g.11156 Transcript_4458/m.11156 type:complete len:259 (+) Transcript_4458:156-932(+)
MSGYYQPNPNSPHPDHGMHSVDYAYNGHHPGPGPRENSGGVYYQGRPQQFFRQMTMPVTEDGHILVEMPGGQVGYYEFEDGGGHSSMKNAKYVDQPEDKKTIIAMDPSLLMGMERTLFSALNVGTLVIIMGLGLMAVGKTEVVGTDPNTQGIFLSTAGIVFCVGSYIMHMWRIHRLICGKVLARFDSQLWAGALTALIVFAFTAEVYYALRYPMLERSAAVEIITPPPLPGAPDDAVDTIESIVANVMPTPTPTAVLG